MWKHHSFLSLHQKGRMWAIWCHLVSTKGPTLFLKVHRLPAANEMNAGFDHYYQIVKCFQWWRLAWRPSAWVCRSTWKRHSLVSKEIKISQRKRLRAWWRNKGIDVTLPFPRVVRWRDVSYGSDKPDTRVLTCCFRTWLSGCWFLKSSQKHLPLKTIVVKGAADNYSRKDIDKMTERVAKQYRC